MINHLVAHYGLVTLATIGGIETFRVLMIAVRDLRMLTAEGVNGWKRLSVTGRLTQSAFLFAAFAVLVTIGGRVALADDVEMSPPLVLTLVVACDGVALVLMLKEVAIRRTRIRLDAYYDRVQPPPPAAYSHRRSTDDACE